MKKPISPETIIENIRSKKTRERILENIKSMKKKLNME